MALIGVNLVSDEQWFPSFGQRNGSVHREPVVMIEALDVRPRRKVFLSQLHEFFLKFGHRVRGVRVARWNDAALAGIVAEKFHGSEVERLQFVRRAKQTVLTKWFAAGQFQICAEPAADTLDRQLRKPALDCTEAGVTCDGRSEGLEVVGKAFFRVVPENDLESEKFAQPFFERGGVIQWKLRLRRFAICPQADFPDFRVERASQLMDARRALAVHHFSSRVKNRVDAVVFQNAAAGDARGFERHAVERFDGEYGDSSQLHLPGSQYRNRSPRGNQFSKQF